MISLNAIERTRTWSVLSGCVLGAMLALATSPTLVRAQGEPSVVVTQVDDSAFPEIALEMEVRNPDGSFLLDAPREAFRIREYDVDRPILRFEPPIARERRPTTLVLVVDRSGSMMKEDRIGALKQAVARFVEGLPEGSRVAVVAFGSRVELICPFTEDLGRARSSVERLFPLGNTRFYDAVSVALELLAEESGRRAVLALTDGNDNESQEASIPTLIDSARKLGLPIHTLGLGSEDEIASDDLRAMAEETRGQYYPARRADELSSIYEEIARRIRSSYGLVYRTDRPIPDGTLRPVSVSFGSGEAVQTADAAVYVRGMVVPADGWPRLFLVLLAGLFGLALLPGLLKRRAA